MNGIKDILLKERKDIVMERITVEVNGRGYYIKTDSREKVLEFAKIYEEQIKYMQVKYPNTTEAEIDAFMAAVSTILDWERRHKENK